MRRIALIGFSIVIALLFPLAAFAAETPFTIDELSTELTVSTDGSVHVINHQVLRFSGENEGYVWYTHKANDVEEVEINAVRYVPVDDGGAPIGEWVELSERASNPDRQGEEPGDVPIESLRSKHVKPWFSYDEDDGMVRCYFPADSGSYLLETDYVIRNRVLVYRDVAEIYCRYAHASLPVASHDVTMKALLPKPQGAVFTPGQDVVAWGHGHAIGSFDIAEDASVVYHVDNLESGQYAEAHIIFPASWMTEVTEGNPNSFPEVRRQKALAEEEEWVDLSTRGANWDYEVRVLFLALAAALILVGAICTARFGRTYRSRLALIRVACTLGIMALFVNLFFRESFTVMALAVAAVVVLGAAMLMPKAIAEEEPAGQDARGEQETQGEQTGASFPEESEGQGEDADALSQGEQEGQAEAEITEEPGSQDNQETQNEPGPDVESDQEARTEPELVAESDQEARTELEQQDEQGEGA